MLQKSISNLYSLALTVCGFHREYRHPLAEHTRPLGKTPQEIARETWKQNVLQARITAIAERYHAPQPAPAPDYRVGTEDPCDRLDGFIEQTVATVDAVLYRAGLC